MNSFYQNRLIKFISPLNDEVFTLELGGDENELRELISTILNIPPHSIKGIRDSFGNYYTLSSAIKNPHLTSDFSSFYVIIINTSSLSLSPLPSSKSAKGSFLPLTVLPKDDIGSNSVDTYIQLCFKLYEDKFIDDKQLSKLKQLVYDENDDVCSAFKLFYRQVIDIKKLSLQLIDIMNNVSLSPRMNKLKFKKTDSLNSAATLTNTNTPVQSRNPHLGVLNTANINNNNNNTKQQGVSSYNTNLSVLSSLEYCFDNKNDIVLLKKLLLCDNEQILTAINAYESDNDQKKLLTKLNTLLRKYRMRFSKGKNMFNPQQDSILDLKVGESPKEAKMFHMSNHDEQGNVNVNVNMNIELSNEDKVVIDKLIKKIKKMLSNKQHMNAIRFDCLSLMNYDFDTMNYIQKKTLLCDVLGLPMSKDVVIQPAFLREIAKYYTEVIQNKILSGYNYKEIEVYNTLAQKGDEALVELYKRLVKKKNVEKFQKMLRELIEDVVVEIEKNEESVYDEDEEEDNEEEGEGEYNESEEEGVEEEDEDDDEEEDEDDESQQDNDNNDNDDEESSAEKGNNNVHRHRRNNNNNNYYEEQRNDSTSNEYIVNKKRNDNTNVNANVNANMNVNARNSNSNNNNNKATTNINANAPPSLTTPTTDNKKLTEFIKVINGMSLPDEHKKEIQRLLNTNNEKILHLFTNFQKNRLSLTKKSLLQTIGILPQKNSRQISTNNSIVSSSTTNDFESKIKHLLKKEKINEQTYSYIVQKYNEKQEMLLSFWEMYTADNDEDDFYDNIDIFINKYKNHINKHIPQTTALKNVTSQHKDETTHNVQPQMKGTSKSINRYGEDLKKCYMSNNANKDLKEKQKKIIDWLIKKSYITNDNVKLIYELIDKEEQTMTSAFEVFSVTFNHLDFVETLNVIVDKYNKKHNEDGNGSENGDNGDSSSGNGKKMFDVLKVVIENGEFSSKEKNILNEELNNNNAMLMSILESFDPDDVEDTVDTVATFLKKLRHSRG